MLQTTVEVPIVIRAEMSWVKWEFCPSDSSSEGVPISVFANAWTFRSYFFSLRTDEEAVRFLGFTGHFSIPEGERNSQTENVGEAGIYNAKDVLDWVEILKTLLAKNPAKWYTPNPNARGLSDDTPTDEEPDPSMALGYRTLFGGVLDKIPWQKAIAIMRKRRFNLEFRWRAGIQSGIIRTHDTLGTILATIYVDHLRGAKFAFCKRPDCGKSYQIKSKHARKFCSQKCASLVSLRDLRERRRKIQKKARAAAKRLASAKAPGIA